MREKLWQTHETRRKFVLDDEDICWYSESSMFFEILRTAESCCSCHVTLTLEIGMSPPVFPSYRDLKKKKMALGPHIWAMGDLSLRNGFMQIK